VLRTFYRAPAVPYGFTWAPPSVDLDVGLTFSRRF
jgi:hypothetical protein